VRRHNKGRAAVKKAAFFEVKSMNYVALILLIVALTVASGCSSGYVNNASAVSNGATPIVLPTVATPDKNGEGNECRICGFDSASYKGELRKDEIDGLLLALNDEYLATATYQQVNKDLRDPRPFINIVQAEIRHADLLKGLLTKYDVSIPENPWPGNVTKFSDLDDACKAGVQAEILNRDLYTRLFKTTERKDILDVYRYLQRASEENHLPAFERCAGGGGRGPRNGPGPRGNR
jgi:hypothetical protein